MSGLRILLTGGNGFLGSALSHQMTLNVKIEVIRWDRRRNGDVTCSACQHGALRSVRPDVVVHAAWLSTGTESYREDPCNRCWADATSEFAEQCAEFEIPMYLMGSARELIPSDDSCYAQSKRILFDRMSPYLAGAVTWVRPFWVYSRSEGRPALLQRCEEATEWKETGIHDPELLLDFIDVRDAVKAIAFCVNESLQGGIVEIGSGQLISIADMVRRLFPHIRDAPRLDQERFMVRAADTSRLERAGWDLPSPH